ncbi:heme-dependent oxidative N-demethylase family protein [Rhodovulum sp. DZ06]|uniref:heme-dependent oxidative N-demethylase family protein n=1 Tax=Rhodovulum sp. DZ06 TaxID=3425126 RepID=UPI003D358F86
MIPAWALPRMTIRPWMETRSAHPPGISPLDPAEWLYRDETCAGQMALRDALVAERPDDVTGCLPEGEAAAAELLALVTEEVCARQGAARTGGAIRRADGVEAPLDAPPMQVAARLAQEDFLILDRPEGAEEHILTAGALCFPAQWTLAEKLGRALLRIHLPVKEYDGRLAAKVQRFHDGVRVGRPLIRANWNFAEGPELYTPAPEAEKMKRRQTRADPKDWRDAWIRVERQTLLRLPQTGAVVFGVRTLVAPLTGCTEEDWAGFQRAFEELPEHARADKAGAAILAEAARRAALA